MLRRGGIFAFVALTAAAFAPAAHASLYTNPQPITTPQCMQSDCNVFGAGNPYPSTIAVDGLPPIKSIRVTVRGIEHTSPSDIDVLLAAPGGQKEMVMSDACGGAPLTGQTLMFDVSGPPLPSSGPCAPGVYAATDYTGNPDTFPPPAPSPPYPSSLGDLSGASPNGIWRLFVTDTGAHTGVGNIGGGWRLELLPAVSCAGRSPTAYADVGTAGGDFIIGTPGPDVLIGLGGNDTIKGLGGKDVICGGPGKDKLLGGPGKDILKGQGGKDKLKGQGGKDSCVGGAKRDTAKSCEKEKSV